MDNLELLKIIKEQIIKVAPATYEIPKAVRNDMRVPARIFLTEDLLEQAFQDRSFVQIINVATIPGIQEYAYAMPDVHEGYGFPIGGVAATAIHEGGVISPGGIGYDINCGVRLLALSMTAQEIKPFLEDLATELFYAVPSGVGRGGNIILKDSELDKVLEAGAQHMLNLEFGLPEDIKKCEEHGMLASARADAITYKAKTRGRDQLGTLGSGNHFLEIQKVEKILDQKVAQVFGLEENMVTLMIHCGSRGLGHQTCTDYVAQMIPKLEYYGITLPDPELACAPFNSPEGQEYYAAMCASANFAWANRHLIGHWVRQAVYKIISKEVTVSLIYDISHNMGKREMHMIGGKQKDLLVHRKGATRAFGPQNPEIIIPYRATGHPVLIPGTMGTASYVLVGTKHEIAFGSSCHGAGRSMSRAQAKKEIWGDALRKKLEAQDIIVRCESSPGLAEEAPIAYKKIEEVVAAVEQAQLARAVARLVPLAVIKGG